MIFSENQGIYWVKHSPFLHTVTGHFLKILAYSNKLVFVSMDNVILVIYLICC